MSTYFAGPFQRKAMEKHDGEVTIASIWLAFYLLMVVGTLFVNRNGFRDAACTFRRRPRRMGRAWLAPKEESRPHHPNG